MNEVKRVTVAILITRLGRSIETEGREGKGLLSGCGIFFGVYENVPEIAGHCTMYCS